MRFNINDKIKITLRDETIIGFVTEINEHSFKVVNENGEYIGELPNDVGNYVTKL